MVKIDLDTIEYSTKFAAATIYAKKGVIRAVQITEHGLHTNAYADKDVRFDSASGQYVIDTYVMREDPITGIRNAALEDTRSVQVGEWIATNPRVCETDHDNHYAIPDEIFNKRYEATNVPGVYRAKGMARIITNDTGASVEIAAPWGGTQNGDAACYFCAPFDRDHPDDLAESERYILSENDFATYGPADEVLGAH